MKNILFLELVPVVLILYLWADELTGIKVLFHIDNLALVSIMNERSYKNVMIMKLFRPFVLLTMLSNVLFKAVHVEGGGGGNAIADSISRFQMTCFRSLAPTAEETPAEITPEFWTLISSL